MIDGLTVQRRQATQLQSIDPTLTALDVRERRPWHLQVASDLVLRQAQILPRAAKPVAQLTTLDRAVQNVCMISLRHG